MLPWYCHLFLFLHSLHTQNSAPSTSKSPRKPKIQEDRGAGSVGHKDMQYKVEGCDSEWDRIHGSDDGHPQQHARRLDYSSQRRARMLSSSVTKHLLHTDHSHLRLTDKQVPSN